MSNGLKAGFGVTAVLLLAVAVRVGIIYHANHEAGPVRVDPYANKPAVSQDDLVFLRKQRPDKPDDEKPLIGKTIWISAGGQLSYYKDAGGRVDYSKPVGTLAGATPLEVKSVFQEKAPASGPAVLRIPGGERQVLLGFTLPNSGDPKQLYATPVGYLQDGNWTFFSDEIFFYDDPRQLYKHWGPEMWADIDQHKPVLGMSENQAMMALGEVTKPDSDNTGNRDVWFENNGHPVTIDFEHNKAVKITPGS